MSGDHLIAHPFVDVSFRTDLTGDQIAVLWRALELSAHQSFFLSWRWIGCWLRQTGLTPNLLMAHVGGRLIGLALVQPETGATFPYLLGRHLTASGNPSFDSVFVEYNGFLTASADRIAVGEAFRRFFARQPSGKDLSVLWSRLHLPGTSDEMRSLWIDDRLVVRTEASRSAPFIDLGDLRKSGKSYLDSRSSNCRQQIRRSMRLFQGQETLELEVASSLDDARVIFDDLKLLHQRRWQSRGKPGAFAIPFFERFHRALLDEAWPSGQIELLRLRAGSKVVGCLYNFLYDGNAYAYQSGFAYDDDARHKPGLVAHAMAAERYLTAGLDRYLLLAGESRYKTSLATGADMLHWLVIRRKGLRAATEEWAEKVGRRLHV